MKHIKLGIAILAVIPTLILMGYVAYTTPIITALFIALALVFSFLWGFFAIIEYFSQ